MAREGEDLEMQNGLLTVQIESEKGTATATASKQNGKGISGSGEVAGSAGPLYHSGMSPLEGGQVNDAK